MEPRLKQLLIQLIKNKWLKIVIAVLFLIYVVIMVNKYRWLKYRQSARKCFMDTNHSKADSDDMHPFKRLEDVLLLKPYPTSRRTIFFIETSCALEESDSMLKLTTRQACAIESAARHNPYYEVFVLFTYPWYYLPSSSSSSRESEGNSLTDVIQSYPNVYLRYLNIKRFTAGSSIGKWLERGDLFQSRYLTIHMSDMLRLLVLQQYGGIYVDLDVIFLRSIEYIPLNFLVAESDIDIVNGVMGMAPTGIGLEFSTECIRFFQEHYNSNEWGANGPYVIQRVAQKLCGTENITLVLNNPERCRGFRIFDSSAFLAVHWTYWEDFFNPDRLDWILEKTNGSYLTHLWNGLSLWEKVKVGSSTGYGKLAEKHCPKAYAAAGEYF